MYFFEAFHLKNMQMDLFLISFHFSEKKKKKKKKLCRAKQMFELKLLQIIPEILLQKKKKENSLVHRKHDKHFLLN